MTTYYIDSSAAQSGNGLSQTAAINNLSAVNALRLAPGDSVLFKDGSSFTGSTPWSGILNITAHGTASDPITFGTYGTGAAPTFSNVDTNWSSTVSFTGASYVNLQGLSIISGMQAGIKMDSTTQNVTISNMDISHAGTGIILDGSSNSVLNNKIHDLNMVVNTPTTVNNNDDFGATAVIITGTGHTISGNTINNAKASSYDYGVDGGAFEFWQNASNVHVSNNVVTNSAGFLEMGGQPGSFSNIAVDHNVSFNAGTFAVIHNASGAFGATISGIQLYDNSIVNTNNPAGAMSTVWLDGSATKQQFSFYDNIVSLNSGDSVFEQHGDYHYNNIIDLKSAATHLYNNWDMMLNSGESYATPGFVDLAAGDLHITQGGVGAGMGAYAGTTATSTTSTAPTSITNTSPTTTTSTSSPTPDTSSASSATTTTASATPTATVTAPTNTDPLQITALSVHAVHNHSLDFSQMVSMTGQPAELKFVDWWNTPGSGHFELNGVALPQAHEQIISADMISSLHYVVGTAGLRGQDLLQFQVSNDGGQTWGTNGTDWGWATVSIIPV